MAAHGGRAARPDPPAAVRRRDERTRGGDFRTRFDAVVCQSADLPNDPRRIEPDDVVRWVSDNAPRRCRSSLPRGQRLSSRIRHRAARAKSRTTRPHVESGVAVVASRQDRPGRRGVRLRVGVRATPVNDTCRPRDNRRHAAALRWRRFSTRQEDRIRSSQDGHHVSHQHVDGAVVEGSCDGASKPSPRCSQTCCRDDAAGSALAVWHDGQMVVALWGGSARDRRGLGARHPRPCSYSVSCGTAVRGRLRADPGRAVRLALDRSPASTVVAEQLRADATRPAVCSIQLPTGLNSSWIEHGARTSASSSTGDDLCASGSPGRSRRGRPAPQSANRALFYGTSPRRNSCAAC